MPRNVYFTAGYKQEQHLYEDLVIEALKTYGQDVYYLPRNVVNRDDIFNEDVESSFDDAYMIEMYVENVDGFEGEGNLMQKFGLEIRDEATFIVAKRSWEKLVGIWNNDVAALRPLEGDIIYLPMSNAFFEISFVEHEQPFYQLNNLPVYKLQCRLFEYNSEDFETGIADIDQIDTVHANTTTILVEPTLGEFNVGDTIYQVYERDTAGDAIKWVSGEIADMEQVTSTTYNFFMHDIGTSEEEPLGFKLSTSGNTSTYFVNDLDSTVSNAEARIIEIYEIDSDTDLTFSNDNSAQNYQFEEAGNDIIDFSEHNPFGEPSLSPPVVTSTTTGTGTGTGSTTSTTMDSDTTTMDSDSITMDTN